MANYPSYDINLASRKTEESGIVDDYAESGGQHSRTFYSNTYRFTLVHVLTLAQFTSLKTTYDANKRTALTLSYLTESPLVTYSVKFTGPPQITANLGLDLFRVEVPLRGTKD